MLLIATLKSDKSIPVVSLPSLSVVHIGSSTIATSFMSAFGILIVTSHFKYPSAPMDDGAAFVIKSPPGVVTLAVDLYGYSVPSLPNFTVISFFTSSGVGELYTESLIFVLYVYVYCPFP